jgi:HSP20 family protein
MNMIPQSKSTLARSFNNEFQRLFDRFFDHDNDIKTAVSNFDWTPSVDVVEKDKCYLLKVDLPGVDPKDVDITAEDGMLSIRGERHQEKTEDKNGQRLTESNYGSFYRSFSLPNGVGMDDIKANSKHGVIEIEIPKAKTAAPKKIQINH